MADVPTTIPANGFAGLRVLTLESRRAQEMAKLIVNNGGQAVVAPSMREVPLESNVEAQTFARILAGGGFDVVIFLTGVGTRALCRVVETIYSLEKFVAALRKIAIVVRGPKPLAVLKEWGVPVALTAPEPNTWREILHALDENVAMLPLRGRRVAVQEYGVSNPELRAGLVERGAQVTLVPVYEWGLPVDAAPLRSAAMAVARGEIDVVLFTSAMQANNFLQIARDLGIEEEVLRAFSRILVASIGPVTSERLHDLGLSVDIEATHAKMGYLVGETASRSNELLRRKRASAP